MNAEITVEYSEDLLRSAARRIWLTSIGWSGFIAFGLSVLGFTYLLLTADSGWYVPVFGTILALAFSVGTAGYFVYRHRALSVFRQMREPRASMRFDEEGLSARSDLGSTQVRWETITKVFRYPDVWLLVYVNGAYSTLPTRALSEDLRQFIIRKIESTGGKAL